MIYVVIAAGSMLVGTALMKKIMESRIEKKNELIRDLDHEVRNLQMEVQAYEKFSDIDFSKTNST